MPQQGQHATGCSRLLYGEQGHHVQCDTVVPTAFFALGPYHKLPVKYMIQADRRLHRADIAQRKLLHDDHWEASSTASLAL